jgi:hypothetical protein
MDLDPGSCSLFIEKGKGVKDRVVPVDIHTISLALILAR